MKNKKKIIIIITVILSILIIIGGLGLLVYKFYKGVINDRKVTENQVNLILDKYKTFKDNIVIINEKREVIYETIFKNNYYSQMQGKQDEWNNLLKEYEDALTKLDKDSKSLKKSCLNNKLINNDVIISCDSFNSNYELIINSFVQDIELYNQNIESYNNWVDTNDSGKYVKMDKYESNNFKDYIDYNSDGIFLGKE